MLNLARGFAERDWLVDIVLVKAEGPLQDQIPSKVRVVDLAQHRTLSSIPHLVHYLRQERPKVLISALYHANIVALLAKRVSGIDVHTIVSEHNTMSLLRQGLGLPKSLLMMQLIRSCYRWADSIVAVSHGVAQDLSVHTGIPLSAIDVVYNPVITPQLRELASEVPEHPWFRDGDTRPIVLGAGRLAKEKDFPTLIKAFGLVLRALPARLIIIGEGPMRIELETLIRNLGLEEHVSLPGFVSNPYAYYARSAVFVLSSVSEGFSNVLVEAQACGTPVVSTDCPYGPSEILNGGEYGRLVPVGDCEELARAILQELTSPTPSAENPLLSKFAVHSVISQYEAIIAEIMSRS
ncbi:MAG: glycosyl transferase [Symbiobacterium thermophilum]|uniref:Glycosyl transferase n=2 Tax=Symbiobacterium thermophilum TaxID=2734 RepID=A0A953LGU6_SYMTR|nr:glycosyl transferase [Symbiobacterium thermophilum]